MAKFLGHSLGKMIILNLSRGDLLLETIEEELENIKIKDAIITSAIGSLQKVVLHRVRGFSSQPEDEWITLEKPMELASLQGIVIDGQPHFHMVVSDTEQTYTGHLEHGTTVLYLAEITLMEIIGLDLKRVKDANNIAVLKGK